LHTKKDVQVDHLNLDNPSHSLLIHAHLIHTYLLLWQCTVNSATQMAITH